MSASAPALGNGTALNGAPLATIAPLATVQASALQDAVVQVGMQPTGVAVGASAAYVANQGSDNVSVIDLTQNTVSATIPVGDGPDSAALSPDGSRLDVANFFGGTVSIISTATNTVSHTVTVGSRPTGVLEIGSSLYVANLRSSTISVIDPSAGTVTGTISLPSGSSGTAAPSGLAASADGHTLYANDARNNMTDVVDLTQNPPAVTGNVSDGSFPAYLSVAQSTAYVASPGSNSISVLDLSQSPPVLSGSVPVGTRPYGVVALPKLGEVLATNSGDGPPGDLSVIDTSTNNVVSTVATGTTPDAIAVGPDHTTAIIANEGDTPGTISVMHVNQAPINTVPSGQQTLVYNGSASTHHQIVFSSGNGNQISTTDPESALPPGAPVKITLSVSHGTLTLSQTTNLTFVSGSNGSGSMTFTGQLSDVNAALAGLTYEPTTTYHGPDTLTLTDDDQGNSGVGKASQATTNTVSIDVTDSTPTDISLSSKSVDENQPVGTTVGTFSTTDPDPGDAFTYSLDDGGCGGGPNDNGSFQIPSGANNNTLQTNASFDFETKSSYSICVRVHDSNLTFDQPFTITVNNVNEPPTGISLDNSSIAENQPAGSLVGNLSQTGDPDSGESYTFSLETSGCGGSFPDSASSNFQISGSQLQSAKSFDFETKNSYSICVRVHDSNLTFDQPFTITINNVNDAPTDISLSNSSINENVSPPATIGTLSATDQDTGQTHSFTLQNTGCGGGPFPDNNSFQISSSTLQSTASFDFETKNSYTICVRTTDSGSPALSFDKQFTITIIDVNDAPVANGDTYTDPVGNTLAVTGPAATAAVSGQPQVPLSAANAQTQSTLIGNDTDQDKTFPHTLSAVAETVTTSHGGTATIRSDGSFTFTPKAGDKSTTDTFTYHVTDGSATTAGTATIQIGSPLVWYVNNALPSNGDGRSSSPFNSLSGVNGAGGSGDADGTGDIIFLYQGSGNYTGGLPLEASQTLIGQPQGLNIGGNQIVAAGGSNPAITNSSGAAITLANDNVIQRVNATGASGAGVTGTSITTLNYGSNTTISGNTGGGVVLSGAAGGNLDIGAAISTSAGHSVSIANRSSGTAALSGAVNDTGQGISLTSNTGATISFSNTITASTGSSPAFTATGGGTINATGSGSTLTTTTGTALDVENTTIGGSNLTFQSITANGGSHGIVLISTGSSGHLAVTGTGSAGTGGSITGITGADLATNNCGDLGSTAPVGVGVYLKNTTSPSLAYMTFPGTFGNFGILGYSVSGFTLDHTTMTGTYGDNVNVDDDTVHFCTLTGSASITNDTISNGAETNLRIVNASGSLNRLTMTSDTFGLNSTAGGGDGVLLEADNSGTVLNATVEDSTFLGSRGSPFGAVPQAGASMDLVFGQPGHGNTIHNTHSNIVPFAQDLNVAAGGTLTFDINSNHFDSASAVQAQGGVFINAANSTAVASGYFRNNTIGNSGVANSGSSGNDPGLDVESNGGGDLTIKVDNNQMYQWGSNGAGFLLQAGATSGSPTTVNATITNNTIKEPGSFAVTNNAQGFQLNNGTNTGENFTTCLSFSGNVLNGSGTGAGGDSRFRQRFDTKVQMPGYTGASNGGTSFADMRSYIQGLNPTGPPTVTGVSSTANGGGFFNTPGGAACPTPNF